MAENKAERIIEQWVNAKFDGKVVISLVKKGTFYNPQLSIIKGKEYETKLGKATQVQLGIGDLKTLSKTINDIIAKMEQLIPKKEQQSPSGEQEEESI